jgi:hypothetical protein
VVTGRQVSQGSLTAAPEPGMAPILACVSLFALLYSRSTNHRRKSSGSGPVQQL